MVSIAYEGVEDAAAPLGCNFPPQFTLNTHVPGRTAAWGLNRVLSVLESAKNKVGTLGAMPRESPWELLN